MKLLQIGVEINSGSIGKINKLGQLIITRNCGFEASDNSKTDWVNSCLADIKNAFYCNKPAVVSTLRVNYVSGTVVKNDFSVLNELSKLLKRIIKKWPDVEFITSNELGTLIKELKNA